MTSQPHLQAVPGNSWTGETNAPPTPPAPSPAAGAPSGSSPSGSGGGRSQQKSRADKSLPTDRLGFDKQTEVLGSIAQISGNSKRPVTAEDLSAALGLKGNTGGLSNKFFRDTGWVESTGRGTYAATEPLMEYFRHLQMDPADSAGARKYLAVPMMNSWYWQELAPMLEGGPLKQTMALHALSKAAGAYEHKPQLLLIIDWLEWTGLLNRDGDNLVKTSAAAPSATPPADDDAADLAEPTPDAAAARGTETVGDVAEPAPRTGDPITAPIEPAAPTIDVDALVSFNFSVRITADDMAKLNGDQLQALLQFAEKLRG